MSETVITPDSVLGVFTQRRILDLARVFGVRLQCTFATKRQLAQSLGAHLADCLRRFCMNLVGTRPRRLARHVRGE